MKAVIIEDEALIARNLQRQIAQLDSAIEVVTILGSVKESVKWFNSNPHPDLIFMDIQLGDGLSFDIFSQVQIDRPVIFTTAYNEYAIRAFKVNSVDYLLKPVDKEYLGRAIEKYKKLFAADVSTVGIHTELQSFLSTIATKNEVRYRSRFLAHYKNGIVPVADNRVSYFLKDMVIYLVTTENEKLVTDYNTIDEIEEVADPARFFRANRQMILHIDQVDNYKKHDTGKIEVHLKCDKNMHADISREKANDFKDWIDR
jgi:DNA-binding LytR/AlgR family response regulator